MLPCPIYILDDDVLRDIFDLVIEMSLQTWQANLVQDLPRCLGFKQSPLSEALALSHVCRRFRLIIIPMASIWSKLLDTDWYSAHTHNLWTEVMIRAKEAPLRICHQGRVKTLSDSADAVNRDDSLSMFKLQTMFLPAIMQMNNPIKFIRLELRQGDTITRSPFALQIQRRLAYMATEAKKVCFRIAGLPFAIEEYISSMRSLSPTGPYLPLAYLNLDGVALCKFGSLLDLLRSSPLLEKLVLANMTFSDISTESSAPTVWGQGRYPSIHMQHLQVLTCRKTRIEVGMYLITRLSFSKGALMNLSITGPFDRQSDLCNWAEANINQFSNVLAEIFKAGTEHIYTGVMHARASFGADHRTSLALRIDPRVILLRIYCEEIPVVVEVYVASDTALPLWMVQALQPVFEANTPSPHCRIDHASITCNLGTVASCHPAFAQALWPFCISMLSGALHLKSDGPTICCIMEYEGNWSNVNRVLPSLQKISYMFAWGRRVRREGVPHRIVILTPLARILEGIHTARGNGQILEILFVAGSSLRQVDTTILFDPHPYFEEMQKIYPTVDILMAPGVTRSAKVIGVGETNRKVYYMT